MDPIRINSRPSGPSGPSGPKGPSGLARTYSFPSDELVANTGGVARLGYRMLPDKLQVQRVLQMKAYHEPGASSR